MTRLRSLLALLLVFQLSPGLIAEEAAKDDPHLQVYSESDFPSASQCAGCHQQIYDEWSSSNHAYAGISPMFHKFEQAINNLAPTIDHFCVRCHMSVGTTLGENRELPLWERSQVSREGVTCITCHRVKENFYKVNGERRIEPGNIFSPVYTSSDGSGLEKILEEKGKYRIATEPGERGAKIHNQAIQFETIDQSEFCVSCHQVMVNLGIKLEVVWDQYRDSPAHENDIQCQQCHMSATPGIPGPEQKGSKAMIGRKKTDPKGTHANHSFFGPGYPIAHPGIFPHHPDAEDWTIEEWLAFDYRAGWGTEDFEDELEELDEEPEFPEVWEDRSDREDAREIIEENLEKLEAKREARQELMENGSRIDGPFFVSEPVVGKKLKFKYEYHNLNSGHNLPSGSLGAQPEIWLNVALVDPDGKTIWESGYVDSVGDMADLHSLDVRAGKIAHDDQLFNLQTKFLTTNVKGTDREMYLPVNFDVDQIPFLRPAQQPVTVMNHPPFVRMEGRSIPPLGKRDANYVVPAELLQKPGTYKLAVRGRSRAEPIYFMRFVGATSEMEQAMNEWMLDMHAYTVEFDVKEH
ncbi:MAG TPA: cytochrome C [Porticoccaceae bacterium]|nr:cytochrome C [Porticoccaceae bacterium]